MAGVMPLLDPLAGALVATSLAATVEVSPLRAPWDFLLILLFLAVAVPLRGRQRMKHLLALAQVTSLDRLTMYATTIGVQWALAALVVWRALDRGFSLGDLAIAVPHGRDTAVVTLALVAVIGTVQFFALRRLAQVPAEQRGFTGILARKLLPQNAVESLAFFALAATVGVCEEVVYRGFVFTALAHIAGDAPYVGLVGSAVLFSVAHLYQGRRGMISTFVAGLLFGIARLTTGSIAPAIIAHALADLVAGLAAPRLIRRAERKSAEAKENASASSDQ